MFHAVITPPERLPSSYTSGISLPLFLRALSLPSSSRTAVLSEDTTTRNAETTFNLAVQGEMRVAYAAQSLLSLRLEEGAAGPSLAPPRQTPPRLPCHLPTHRDCFHTCLRAFREANFQDTVLELGGGLLPLHAYRQGHGA